MTAIDLSLGIFFGWLLIQVWIKFCTSLSELHYLLNKYFEMKHLAAKTIKDQK